MGNSTTIDIDAMTEQLGVIAWRMAETLPEYLPFLLTGGLLILFSSLLRRPRGLAVAAARKHEAWDEEPDTSPGVALVAKTLRLTLAMVMRVAGRLVIIGCLAVVTLRASGFEETTAFVDANFETLTRIVQAFR